MNSFVTEIEKKVAELEVVIQDQPNCKFSIKDKELLQELPSRLLTCINAI
jgi:hypothetical protein